MLVSYGYWISEHSGVSIECIMQDSVAHIIDADNGYIGSCYSFTGFSHLIESFYGNSEAFYNILLNDVDIDNKKLMDAAKEWFDVSQYENKNTFKLFE